MDMTPERMDRPQPVNAELRQTLHELDFLNRYFGGHGYLRRFLSAHFRSAEKTCRILDLGTGGGDFPRAMVDWARKNGRQISVVAVDRGAAIVKLAEQFSKTYPEITFVEGNAMEFDRGEKYDLVHCSLSLHHFQQSDAVALLRRMRKLTVGYALMTDLVHGWLTTWGVGLINRVFGHARMTVEDGDTSARRAYQYEEVEDLARRAGWNDFRHERFAICRQALWMRVGSNADFGV